MTALRAALSLLVILFAGWGIAFLLPPRRKSVLDLAAHSWLLGAIAVSITLGVLGAMFSGAALLVLVTIVSAIPGAVALRRILLKRDNDRVAWPRPRGFLEWALCAVILCQCVILARFAWTTAIGWDGLMVWEIKSRIAFSNGGSLPLDYFCDASRSSSHPDYPLMLPLLETWVYMGISQSNESWVRIIFPLFYLAALILLVSGAARISGKRWVGLLTAALLFFIPFATARGCNAFTGYADFPLAVFYLAGVTCFIKFTRHPANSPPILFAIYAGALPWIKQEGTYLWIFLMLAAVEEFIRKGKPRLILLTSLPGLLTIVGWKIALYSVRAIPSDDFLPVTIANVLAHAPRIGATLRTVAAELCSIEKWSLLWILLPVALAGVAFKENRILGIQLAAFILMPLAFYSVIYILSSWNPYQAHIACSLPRLLLGLSLVALLTLGSGVAAIFGMSAVD
jgi:hypothetical protein